MYIHVNIQTTILRGALEAASTPIPSGLLTTTRCLGGVSLPSGPRVADSGNPRTVIKNVETQVLKGEFFKMIHLGGKLLSI